MLVLLLFGCPQPFDGDTAPTDDHDTNDDTDTDTGLALAEDDARVRALTDLEQGENPAAEPMLVRVDYVVDGDTFYCTPDGTAESLKVRMIGIDTPEIAHDDAAECYGNQAWAYTGDVLAGRLAWLTFDEELYDDYDRALAYVFRDDSDAGFVNRHLARQGYATPLTIRPNDSFESEIEADAQAAASEGLGLWSACE